MTLPTNTTDRLLAVADIIELTPERWDQDEWVVGPWGYEPSPYQVSSAIDDELRCPTRACVAGWAVALSPIEFVVGYGWGEAGALALGLDRDLASLLFDAGLPFTASELADVLRRLAKLPRGARGFYDAKTVLTPDQWRTLEEFDEAY